MKKYTIEIVSNGYVVSHEVRSCEIEKKIFKDIEEVFKFVSDTLPPPKWSAWDEMNPETKGTVVK